MEGTESTDDKGFAQRIKESPRTVSALIIILIVAAAIYAFSGPQANQSPAPTENAEGITDTTDNNDEEGAEEETGETPASPQITPLVRQTPSPRANRSTPGPQSTIHPVTTEQLTEQVKNLPEEKRVDEGYMEVAQPGDGLTHLARRASTRWLADNQADFQVTNEHRIYIEDYIQKKMGSKRLSLNQEETVSFELIQEAVAKAKDLNEQQLRNLTKYSSVLTP